MTETTWIEFEAWMDSRSICGYMNLEDANDDEPLQFYTWDGFEGGHHISVTRFPSFTDNEEYEWETLVGWLNETDIVQYLVDFAEEKKVFDFTTTDSMGRPHDVKFYINCSRFDEVSEKVQVKSTTIRIKQSTKEQLKKIGGKGDSYDEIIRSLLE